MESKSLQQLIDIIFSNYPKPPCTYMLTQDSPNFTLFQLLMTLLISGAKKLYGEHITPSDITDEQFKELQSYIESVGYKIKYNFTDIELDIGKQKVINIWFEPFLDYVNCHGIRIVK
jgi:hypothetical protein